MHNDAFCKSRPHIAHGIPAVGSVAIGVTQVVMLGPPDGSSVSAGDGINVTLVSGVVETVDQKPIFLVSLFTCA